VNKPTYRWGDFRIKIEPQESNYLWRVQVKDLEIAQKESESALSAFQDARVYIARHLTSVESRLEAIFDVKHNPMLKYYSLAEELDFLVSVGQNQYPPIRGKPLQSFQKIFESDIENPEEALQIVLEYIEKYRLNDFGEEMISIDDYQITLLQGTPVRWSVSRKPNLHIGSGKAQNRNLAIRKALNRASHWINAHRENLIGKEFPDNLDDIARLKEHLARVKYSIDAYTYDENWAEFLKESVKYEVCGKDLQNLIDEAKQHPESSPIIYRNKLQRYIKYKLDDIITLKFLEEYLEEEDDELFVMSCLRQNQTAKH